MLASTFDCQSAGKFVGRPCLSAGFSPSLSDEHIWDHWASCLRVVFLATVVAPWPIRDAFSATSMLLLMRAALSHSTNEDWAACWDAQTAWASRKAIGDDGPLHSLVISATSARRILTDACPPGPVGAASSLETMSKFMDLAYRRYFRISGSITLRVVCCWDSMSSYSCGKCCRPSRAAAPCLSLFHFHRWMRLYMTLGRRWSCVRVNMSRTIPRVGASNPLKNMRAARHGCLKASPRLRDVRA